MYFKSLCNFVHMTQTLYATKQMNGRQVRRKFTALQWQLIGKDKNGWVEESSQVVEPKEVKLPPKGETTTQKVEVVKKEKETTVEVVDIEVQNNFANIASKLGKGVIKDYFDTHEPPIEYSNTASMKDLRILLAKSMNHNVELLNNTFNGTKK